MLCKYTWFYNLGMFNTSQKKHVAPFYWWVKVGFLFSVKAAIPSTWSAYQQNLSQRCMKRKWMIHAYGAKESLEENALPSETGRQRDLEGYRRRHCISIHLIRQFVLRLTLVDGFLGHLD